MSKKKIPIQFFFLAKSWLTHSSIFDFPWSQIKINLLSLQSVQKVLSFKTLDLRKMYKTKISHATPRILQARQGGSVRRAQFRLHKCSNAPTMKQIPLLRRFIMCFESLYKAFFSMFGRSSDMSFPAHSDSFTATFSTSFFLKKDNHPGIDGSTMETYTPRQLNLKSTGSEIFYRSYIFHETPFFSFFLFFFLCAFWPSTPLQHSSVAAH